jgi:hypothetical protein
MMHRIRTLVSLLFGMTIAGTPILASAQEPPPPEHGTSLEISFTGAALIGPQDKSVLPANYLFAGITFPVAPTTDIVMNFGVGSAYSRSGVDSMFGAYRGGVRTKLSKDASFDFVASIDSTVVAHESNFRETAIGCEASYLYSLNSSLFLILGGGAGGGYIHSPADSTSHTTGLRLTTFIGLGSSYATF